MIAAVIPCYRVKDHILGVLSEIGPEVETIVCVDDACPDSSGDFIEQNCDDDRIIIVRHKENMGVGGATMTGYKTAIEKGATVLVKLDGDGQMDPRLIESIAQPVVEGQADYSKGNRFFNPRDVRAMPSTRLFGNAAVSFLSKISSGYWTIFDPANGFTAIHRKVARQLPFESIAKRYFFESDMLFHLGGLRAVVIDVPMEAHYGTETSGLSIPKIILPFLGRYTRNCFKRIFLNYFLRDFNVGSLELAVGLILTIFGFTFGLERWIQVTSEGALASAGTVMLAALPFILGVQFLLNFINYDITHTPVKPIHPLLKP